ncbi:Membrane protein involved in the export of O-antigen and teichoic acid [Curtobacterium sp. 314Chir4.1]|uniref:lipopolysaccharide biosynthesis protein n=1 Tax=Curtobacterium sp. 314Chir4.1 TaxID=1279028 RepID=UPI000BCA5335|nr:oligosaccharide flippase family protein [Curtobacterium sp. 314Chir4.1]SOC89755.1 Membrane protein involved in the export of O-antigen and teichoic acid [Curtobacterium sp. 314Chir4.1]
MSSRGGNVLIALVGNAFAPLASIATAPILAHALGVTGRGEVAAATAPLLLATALATFGVPAAVTYTVARFPGAARRVARRGALVLTGTGAVVAAAIVVLRGFFAGGDPTIGALVVLAAAALVPTLLVALLQAVAAGAHRWRLVTAERGTTAGVRLGALGALAALGGLDVRSAVVVLAVAPLFGALAYLPLRSGAAPQDTEADRARTRTLVSYGSRVWVGSIAGILLTRLDQALLTPLSGAVELGLYVVAVNVADIPLVVSNAVRDVSFSADAADGDDARMLRASRLSTVTTVLVSAALAASAPWWLPLVFGAEFRAALPACLVLLLATAVGAQGTLAGVTLSARGAPGRRSLSLAVACVVNLVLVVLLVPSLGAVGAAIGTVVGNGLSSSLNIVQVWRRHSIRPVDFYGLRRSDLAPVRALITRKHPRAGIKHNM